MGSKKLLMNFISLIPFLILISCHVSSKRPPAPIPPPGPTPSPTYSNNGPIACIDTTNCIAVGQYSSAVNGITSLLAFSTDGGLTYTSSTSAVTLPANANMGALNSSGLGGITCLGLNCLAVGNYARTDNGIAPLLAFSTDGGVTFISTSDVTLPLDAATGASEFASLYSVTCVDLNCRAVGSYLNTANGIAPLLSLSTDGGVTFTSTSNLTLPGDAMLGASEVVSLFGVTCLDSNCFAVGNYLNMSGAIAPLVASSTNEGVTYTSTSAVALPADANTGINEFAVLGPFG